MRIAVIGGTGKEGRGLAVRWAAAGHHVVLGSRDAARAATVADELAQLAGRPLAGTDNVAALDQADVVLLSVPYAAHGETLRALAPQLANRIVVDITVPLKPPAVSKVQLPAGQSAALEAQAILGPSVKVVAALHHVSSTQLIDPKKSIDCDVLVCGDDAAAKATVLALVGDLGLRALDAGALQNSIALESLTPVLLALNKRYKSVGAGIRFTNLDVS
jgi:8-hydroxy-5-deazaflavin:NADPH oxidoreductase